jgi:hypothetical protein
VVEALRAPIQGRRQGAQNQDVGMKKKPPPELEALLKSAWPSPTAVLLLKVFQSNDPNLALKALEPWAFEKEAKAKWRELEKDAAKQRFGRVDAIAEQIRTILGDDPLSLSERKRLIDHVKELPTGPEPKRSKAEAQAFVHHLHAALLQCGLTSKEADEWAQNSGSGGLT